MNRTLRYSGRRFTPTELASIRQLIADNPLAHRTALSRKVCQMLSWRRPDGALKEMSCRVAMLRMQSEGLIQLPPPLRSNGNGKAYRRRTALAEPELFPITEPAGALADLCIELVERKTSHLWNEYIDRYHYLGYRPLPGAQLRYFARAQGHRVLALLGFGAAAWKIAPRDRFIGWSCEQRQSRLHLVVNNARFLILPWVRSANLASRVLAMTSRRLCEDWQRRYGYRPVLLETFVETPRFRGTCYKAANWTYVGQTKGRGKLDVEHTARLAKKAIWIYPLVSDFRRKLCC